MYACACVQSITREEQMDEAAKGAVLALLREYHDVYSGDEMVEVSKLKVRMRSGMHALRVELHAAGVVADG